MDDTKPEIYLGHKKYIRIIIDNSKENETEEILALILDNLNIKETPDKTVSAHPTNKSITIEWMFNNIVSRKWVNIEPLIMKRLKSLWRKKIIIAYNLTWL